MIGTLIHEPCRSFGTNTDGALTVRAFCERYSIGRTAVYEEINAGRLTAKNEAPGCSSSALRRVGGFPIFQNSKPRP